MEDNRAVCAICGGQMTLGTAALALAGGPIWAIAVFGSLAVFGIVSAIKE